MLDTELIGLNDTNTHAEVQLIPNTHAPITASQILELISHSPYKLFCPDNATINAEVTKINKLCGQDSGAKPYTFLVAERHDAKLDIVLSADRMQAEMILTADWGGKEVVLDDVLAELKNQDIQYGVNSKLIISQLKSLKQTPPGQQVQCVIAEGKKPVKGQDAYLDRKVSLARERMLRPQRRDDDSVDMRNLGAIIMVKPNDLLLVKVPAKEGINGSDVQGKEILPKPVKDVKLVPGKGTELDKDDALKLIATVVGLPIESPNGLQVDDVLTIKNVDVGYGHVDFPGSIVITGDVQAGMIVKSTGDITIMGFVDSATLEADGDIIIHKSVIGRKLKDNTYTSKIASKGQITAQLVQYAELAAKGNITITKQLLHSHTTTQGMLIVSDEGHSRGDLIGGQVHSDLGVKAVIIGAKAGVKTEIFCAMQAQAIKSTLAELTANLTQLITLDNELAAQIKNLPPKKEWAHDRNMIMKIKHMLHEKARITQQRAAEESEVKELTLDLEKYYANHYIEVFKHMFENIEVTIGKASYRTQREYSTCHIMNKDRKITFEYYKK